MEKCYLKAPAFHWIHCMRKPLQAECNELLMTLLCGADRGRSRNQPDRVLPRNYRSEAACWPVIQKRMEKVWKSRMMTTILLKILFNVLYSRMCDQVIHVGCFEFKSFLEIYNVAVSCHTFASAVKISLVTDFCRSSYWLAYRLWRNSTKSACDCNPDQVTLKGGGK